MGQTQTHLESKVFDDVPPWDLEEVTAKTDLTEEEANACWRLWTAHPLVKRGQIKEEAFYKLLGFEEAEIGASDDFRKAKSLFELLDRRDKFRLEFPDLMFFLFSMGELNVEQKLRRSFLLCDQNKSGKISKEEMVDVLDKLEVLDMEHDDKGKVIIPDNVENLFSLMDFAHDGKISEDEFLRATTHYRKLGNVMTISLLEDRRKKMQQLVQEFIQMEQEEEKVKSDKKKKSKKPEAKQESSTATAEESS